MNIESVLEKKNGTGLRGNIRLVTNNHTPGDSYDSDQSPKTITAKSLRRPGRLELIFIPKKGLALGDWVELWAKPIGRIIDWITAKAPTWMVHPANPPGAWVVVSKHPIFKRPWWDIRLSNKWRTGFAKGTCGCQKRKVKLNEWQSDARPIVFLLWIFFAELAFIAVRLFR